MLDATEFGKAMAAIVKEATAPLQKRIEELEARQPERGIDGKDGKDAELIHAKDIVAALLSGEEIKAIIGTRVDDAVAMHFEKTPIHHGKDGKDGVNGKDGASVTVEDVAPMIAEQVAKAVAEIPVPKDGIDGKDADPIDIKDVVAEILAGHELPTLVDLQVAESVAKYFEANPVQHGKDGRDGKDGDVGPKGEKGDPGRDGLDVKDLFRADGGHLVAVMSDGTTKDLGVIVGDDGKDGANGTNGKDGRDGIDGIGFEDCTVEVADGVATLKFVRGDMVKSASFPVPTLRHIGFWGPDRTAKAGDFTTHDGSLWQALRDTKETPSYQSADWQMAARKGADGQKGRDGKDYVPPKPTKVKGDD